MIIPTYMFIDKYSTVQNKNLSSVNTRSSNSDMIKVPVPGYPSLPVNLMATAWNENPELQNASTLGSAKTAAKKWAKLLFT